jgi:hypothetical protein
MKDEDKILTSVKVTPSIFEEFRVNSVKRKFPLQKLVDRAMYLYNTDEEFRKKIHAVEFNNQ